MTSPKAVTEIRLALINVRAAHHDLNLAMPCLGNICVYSILCGS
jgi:hypothetical protein